jgi:hypothetical protein
MASAISRLRETAADLDTALAFTNIPGLFATGPERLRDLYRDLEALLAQLDAMRLQFAEYVEAAADEAEPEPPYAVDKNTFVAVIGREGTEGGRSGTEQKEGKGRWLDAGHSRQPPRNTA